MTDKNAKLTTERITLRKVLRPIWEATSPPEWYMAKARNSTGPAASMSPPLLDGIRGVVIEGLMT